jgi:hypothetical protein
MCPLAVRTISSIVSALTIAQNRQGIGQFHAVVFDGARNELMSLRDGQRGTFF